MPTVDTDYTVYVVWGYAVGILALAGVTLWTVLRLMKAHRQLQQAEKDDAP